MSGLLQGRAYYAEDDQGRQLPAHLKFILAAMCDHANDDGEAVWVGQSRLSLKTSKSIRSVGSSLSELRDMGFIERTSRAKGPGRGGATGSPDHYRIMVDRLPSTDRIAQIVADHFERPEEVSDVSSEERPEVSNGKTGSSSRKDRKPTSTKPSVEPPEEPSDKGGSSTADIEGSEPSDEDLMGRVSAPPAPSDRQVYLAGRLWEHHDRWTVLTYGGIVSLNKKFGRPTVTEVLGRMWEEATSGSEPPKKPFALVTEVCRQVAELEVASA